MLSWIKLQYLALMQEQLIFQPKHRQMQPMREPKHYGLANMQTTDIQTSDGIRLRVWYQAPSKKDMPNILFWQGNTGHIADVGTPKKGEIYHPDYRLRLAKEALKEGYGLIIPTPRGYGASQRTRPSEIGMWHDAAALNDFCVKELTIPSNQLIILGESLGACSALMSAGDLKKRYDTAPLVALIAPFHSISKKIEENHPDISPQRAAKKLRHTLDNSHYLSQLDSSTHVLIITPEDDKTTAPWHSAMLVEHIQTLNLPHSHHLLEGAGHITWQPKDILKLLGEAFENLD